MKKIVSVQNTVQYASDIVTCFERPIANILNKQTRRVGDCFILLSKIYSFYFGNMQEETKSKVLELSQELLRFRVKNHKNSYTYKKIKKEINNNDFIVLGINLKEIFYSEYYKESNWPHWLLVNGYDDVKDIYYILDDVQNRHQSDTYNEFCLPGDLLRKASKSYISEYGAKWSIFSLLNTKAINLQAVLDSVISCYLDFDFDKGSLYTQVALLQELKCVKENSVSEELENNLKRKIINNNKYRTTLFEILLSFMSEFNYDEAYIKQLSDFNILAENLWDCFTTKNILNIITFRAEEIILPCDIIKVEKQIKTIVVDFLKWLKQYNTDTLCITDKISEFICENNLDNIISCCEDSVNFKFNCSKVYDWWFVDDSPKFILAKDVDFKKSYEIITDITICDTRLTQDFQAGVFLKTEKQELFCAYDIKGMLVLDQIGKYNKSIRISQLFDFKMHVKKDNSRIVAEIYDNQDEFINKIEWYIEEADKLSIGFSCKSWGIGGKVKVNFQNYRIEEIK